MINVNIDARGAQEPAAVLAALESQDEVIKLAFWLADSTARADIECLCCCDCSVGRIFTFDTTKADGDDMECVELALRYIELRGDSLPYRVIREGNLIRFEDKS